MHKALLLSLLAVAPAFANPTIMVFPSVAPNAFGSPSYDGYVANAIFALENGLTSYGTPGTPQYYQQTSQILPNQMIVTGFPSWLGLADPGTVFGPAFANELGNRPLFGIVIDGNGSKISIDQLSLSATSNDPGHLLAFAFGAGSYNYSSNYVGIINGAGGPTFVTGGPNTQLVDMIVGRGSGNAFDAYCDGCTIADQQAAIDALSPDFAVMNQFTGTYSYGALATGSATFDVTPEPATCSFMLAGLVLAGVLKVRRSNRT